MRPPCFAETILQYVVRRFKEKNSYLQTLGSQYDELFVEIGEESAFANIDHERGTSDSLFIVV